MLSFLLRSKGHHPYTQNTEMSASGKNTKNMGVVQTERRASCRTKGTGFPSDASCVNSWLSVWESAYDSCVNKYRIFDVERMIPVATLLPSRVQKERKGAALSFLLLHFWVSWNPTGGEDSLLAAQAGQAAQAGEGGYHSAGWASGKCEC